MTLRRCLLEIAACIMVGLLAGAVLMITWHGTAASLRLAHTLLRYVYEASPLSP